MRLHPSPLLGENVWENTIQYREYFLKKFFLPAQHLEKGGFFLNKLNNTFNPKKKINSNKKRHPKRIFIKK